MPDAYIFDTVRTPIGLGKSNGSLYEVKPIDLLRACLNALTARNNLEPHEVGDLIVGCGTPVQNQGHNIAKASLLHANWSYRTSGIQINRYGASGLDAINLGAMKVVSGWDNLIVAGGVESMSRTKIKSDGGALLYDPELINSIGYLPNGIAADLIATLEGFTREDLDEFALESHSRATSAWKGNHFEKSVIPIQDNNGLQILAKDEIYRPDNDISNLSNLSPAFEELGKEGFDKMAIRKYPQVQYLNHFHTAGNSSPFADGAALSLIGNIEIGKKLKLKPRAKILSLANASVDPTIMLTGMIEAANKALKMAKLSVQDIDCWEVNEAFAAPTIKFRKDLSIAPEKMNTNGGSIAFGHPLGATGAILLSNLMNEMERKDLRTGLVALPANAGMGVATIIQRV